MDHNLYKRRDFLGNVVKAGAAGMIVHPFINKFPAAETLDYQAQHTVELATGKTGRYDGLYLSGGYRS